MYLTVVILPLLGSIVAGFFGAVWSRKSLLCLKLSNSGDTLKLLVPSCIRRDTSGWVNLSCKVISQKMGETPIGYHGSKSITSRFG